MSIPIFDPPPPAPEMHPDDLVAFVGEDGRYWGKRERWTENKEEALVTPWRSATLSLCLAPGRWEIISLAAEPGRQEYLDIVRRMINKS